MNDKPASLPPPTAPPSGAEPTRTPAVDTARLLSGNGVALVREREMARRVQAALSRLYAIEATADVAEFIAPAADGDREMLLLRESDDGVEMSLRLMPLAPTDGGVALDGVCQLIEGVSHFVYVAERARADRSATQLELEIQAEVDKYVVLASLPPELDVATSRRLRERLFEAVRYAHAEGSPLGERYRLANAVAHRFTRRLERDFVGPRRFRALRGALREFFHMGQEAKLRAA